MTLLEKLSLSYTNFRSQRFEKKYLFIESDDWGMVRMPSKETKDKLIKKGYKIEQCAFNSYDSVETDQDVEMLLETLTSVKDNEGRPALFIANNIVCNPDFDKIRNDNFENYYFEVFTDTYRKYPDSSRVLELFRKGVEAGAILPQFHGREHVHVNRWLKHLKGRDKNFLEAFENGMFTLTYGRNSSCKLECLDAMAIYDERDAQFISHSIREGMAIFKNIWGFDSHSAIPPCYVWDEEVEKIMANHGVKVMQSGRAQLIPGNHGVRQIRRYTGQKSRNGLMYSVRNVYFEPVTRFDFDWVDLALYQIDNAFRYGAPAIIGSHRLNYTGRIDTKARDFGLKMLKKLLISASRKWPDIEFISPMLGKDTQ